MTGLKYYIYRHVREDIKVPFYIGMGTNDASTCYSRAFSQSGRNSDWWKVMYAINFNFSADVIYETDDKDEILQKEIEFISLYKRQVEGGTLINKSTGGRHGGTGVIQSKETQEKRTSKLIGRKRTPDVEKRRAAAYSKTFKQREDTWGSSSPIYQYALDGAFIKKWPSRHSAVINLGYQGVDFSLVFFRRDNYFANSLWYPTDMGERVTPKRVLSRRMRVIQTDSELNIVNIHESIKHATINYFGNRGRFYSIKKACGKKGGLYKNYLWFFEIDYYLLKQ